jgi:hypothetical protein
MSQTYQSRVFSFISSRTNQLKDTCAKGWRHLKVRVVWSGQILLHPLQILAQATKILKPQLSPAPQPTPDINIEEALYLIETAGYSIKIAIPESLDSRQPKLDPALSIQPQSPASASTLTYQQPQPTQSNFRARVLTSLGKATDILKFSNPLDDRLDLAQLVGVASPLENRTDDGQIDYNPRRPIVRGLSSLLSDRQIVLVTTENELIDTLTIAQQQQIRHRIGIDLATTWEQWQTSRLIQPQTTQTLPDKSQALLTSEANLPAESLFDRFNKWLYNFSRAPEPAPNPVSLQVPLSQDTPPQQLAPARYPTPFIAPLRQQAQWLDLPQLPPITEIDRDLNPESRIISSTPIDFLTKLQPNWLKQWVNYYQDYLYIPNDSREIVGCSREEVEPTVEEFKLTPIEPKYDIMKLDSKMRESRFEGISAKSRPYNIEYQPDWIDTTAENIGYSLSPLSRLLMWLDRIAVKIENWLIGIWNLLQRSSKPES